MQTITNLHIAILWSAVAIFFIVNGLLIYALERLRRKSVTGLGNSPVLETIWTLVPAGILILLLALTFLSVN